MLSKRATRGTRTLALLPLQMAPRVQKKGVKKLPVPSVDQLDALRIAPPQPKKPALYPVDKLHGDVRYWLIKSEPYSRIDPVTGMDSKFSLADLQKVRHEPWDGVRNHEAKNNMLNMRKGDVCLFYHSNAPTPGLVGVAKVANEAHPDFLQFDSKSTYYDPKSPQEAPRWWCVDVTFVRRLRAKISLDELRGNGKLADMSLVKRGRLSVSPVRGEEFHEIMTMEKGRKFAMDIDCEIGEEFV